MRGAALAFAMAIAVAAPVSVGFAQDTGAPSAVLLEWPGRGRPPEVAVAESGMRFVS